MRRYQRARARRATANTTQANEDRTDNATANRKRQSDQKKGPRLSKEQKQEQDLQMNLQMMKLFQRGLEEEDPFTLSKHALKGNMPCFESEKLPSKNRIQLDPHQRNSIGKSNHDINSPNVTPHTKMLHLKMGTGKTYILHGLMQLNKKDGETMLLIVPNSLISQWIRELEEKAYPPLDYCTYGVCGKDGKRATSARDMKSHELILTSFERVRMDYQAMLKALNAMAQSCDSATDTTTAIRQAFPLYMVHWSFLFVESVAFMINVVLHSNTMVVRPMVMDA